MRTKSENGRHNIIGVQDDSFYGYLRECTHIASSMHSDKHVSACIMVHQDGGTSISIYPLVYGNEWRYTAQTCSLLNTKYVPSNIRNRQVIPMYHFTLRWRERLLFTEPRCSSWRLEKLLSALCNNPSVFRLPSASFQTSWSFCTEQW